MNLFQLRRFQIKKRAKVKKRWTVISLFHLSFCWECGCGGGDGALCWLLVSQRRNRHHYLNCHGFHAAYLFTQRPEFANAIPKHSVRRWNAAGCSKCSVNVTALSPAPGLMTRQTLRLSGDSRGPWYLHWEDAAVTRRANYKPIADARVCCLANWFHLLLLRISDFLFS